jgi:hypothetical protein
MSHFIYRQISLCIAGTLILLNTAYANPAKDSFLSKLLEQYPYCDNHICREIGVHERKDFVKNNYSRLIESGIPLLKYYADALALERLPSYYAVIPIIESRNHPQAESQVGAKGIWQLMPSTAFDMGVFRNSQADMRTDVFLSTKAAVRFIGELHKKYHGDPILVLAAYNWGSANVDKHKADLHLKMPSETKNYLQSFFKIGHDLRALDPNHTLWNYPDVHYLKTVSWFEYQTISNESNLDIFNFLNPVLINRTNWVIPTNYFYAYFEKKIAHPSLGFQAVKVKNKLKCYEDDVSPYFFLYIVKQGDTISSIAKRFSLAYNEVLRLNNTYSHLEPGLLIKLSKKPLNKGGSHICLQ